MKCLYQNTLLIPEWQAGDVIAQRTARQGTLPFDFLNLQFPQLSFKGIKEIRIQSHVNFELKSDFITEFAKSAVKPINQFNTDLGRSIPSKIGEDVNVSTPSNVKVKVGLNENFSRTRARLAENITDLDRMAFTTLDVDAFLPYFRNELILAGQSTVSLDRSILKARLETRNLEKEVIDHQVEQSRLLHSYIEAEEAKTKELEKMIDRMRHPDTLLSENDLPHASFVAKEEDLAGARLEKYNQFIGTSQSHTRALALGSDTDLQDLKDAGASLKN